MLNWKILVGSGRGLFEELTQNFTEWTEKKHENLSQDNRYPSRDSNRKPPEYKQKILPLEQLVTE
jgi:hypothetical protein